MAPTWKNLTQYIFSFYFISNFFSYETVVVTDIVIHNGLLLHTTSFPPFIMKGSTKLHCILLLNTEVGKTFTLKLGPIHRSTWTYSAVA